MWQDGKDSAVHAPAAKDAVVERPSYAQGTALRACVYTCHIVLLLRAHISCKAWCISSFFSVVPSKCDRHFSRHVVMSICVRARVCHVVTCQGRVECRCQNLAQTEYALSRAVRVRVCVCVCLMYRMVDLSELLCIATLSSLSVYACADEGPSASHTPSVIRSLYSKYDIYGARTCVARSAGCRHAAWKCQQG